MPPGAFLVQDITLCLDFKSYVGFLLRRGNKLSDHRHQLSRKGVLVHQLHRDRGGLNTYISWTSFSKDFLWVECVVFKGIE